MSDTAVDESAELSPEPMAPPMAARPAEVPEKFWDESLGTVRLDALLKSYCELERKFGASRRAEEVAEVAPDAFASEPDLTPSAVEDWEILSPHPLIEPDGELNDRLRTAGFSQDQAQLVYDLAAEHLLPVIQNALGEIEAEQQADRLRQHFGGVEAWGRTARQLRSWGAANLDPAILETLASSYEGVLALHQMMRASEPALLTGDAEPTVELGEAALVEMMRDPRYWRQRDPEFIARVTAGFKRLYG
ncbi:MAG: hypothetical protein AB7I59_08200 [Geminicoccaceae bacterium]